MYLPGWPTPVPGPRMTPGNSYSQTWDGSYTGAVPPPAPVPQNSRNAPPQAEVDAKRANLARWGAALQRAEAAPIQAAEVAQGGRPGNIDYSGGGSYSGDSDAANALGPGYSASQLQDIADAPVIGNDGQYQTPACATATDNSKVCPPMLSDPPWGNSGRMYPGPKPCKSGVVGWIEKNPWYFIALVIAGGFALDSLMDDGRANGR